MFQQWKDVYELGLCQCVFGAAISNPHHFCQEFKKNLLNKLHTWIDSTYQQNTKTTNKTKTKKLTHTCMHAHTHTITSPMMVIVLLTALPQGTLIVIMFYNCTNNNNLHKDCVCVCMCACVLYALNFENMCIYRTCKCLGPVRVRRSKYPLLWLFPPRPNTFLVQGRFAAQNSQAMHYDTLVSVGPSATAACEDENQIITWGSTTGALNPMFHLLFDDILMLWLVLPLLPISGLIQLADYFLPQQGGG